jgi:chromosome segregation ATPase
MSESISVALKARSDEWRAKADELERIAQWRECAAALRPLIAACEALEQENKRLRDTLEAVNDAAGRVSLGFRAQIAALEQQLADLTPKDPPPPGGTP